MLCEVAPRQGNELVGAQVPRRLPTRDAKRHLRAVLHIGAGPFFRPGRSGGRGGDSGRRNRSGRHRRPVAWRYRAQRGRRAHAALHRHAPQSRAAAYWYAKLPALRAVRGFGPAMSSSPSTRPRSIGSIPTSTFSRACRPGEPPPCWCGATRALPTYRSGCQSVRPGTTSDERYRNRPVRVHYDYADLENHLKVGGCDLPGLDLHRPMRLHQWRRHGSACGCAISRPRTTAGSKPPCRGSRATGSGSASRMRTAG